jgi:hypothetical protein
MSVKTNLQTNNDGLKIFSSNIKTNVKHNVNIALKDSMSGSKLDRVLSAKTSMLNFDELRLNQSNFDAQVQPSSPVQFQSLQTEVTLNSDVEVCYNK